MAGDVELVRDRVALVRQLAPLRRLDDLDHFLDDFPHLGWLQPAPTLRVSATCAFDVLSGCVRLLPSR